MKDVKTKLISFRVTDDEWHVIQYMSKKAKRTVSSMLREIFEAPNEKQAEPWFKRFR